MPVKTIDLTELTRGGKSAWDDFVDRYSPLILSAIGGTFHSRGGAGASDAEDAVQSVFVRLIKDDYHLLKSYNPNRASLSTWLTIVARSVALDFLKRRTPPSMPLDELTVEIPAPAPHEETRLEIPPDLLSPRQKLVLHLLFDKDLPVEDVAKLLKVEPQTVRSTKHKAVQQLRNHFGGGKG